MAWENGFIKICIFTLIKPYIIMSAIELKKLLIHRIAEIDDISFLKALKTILDSKTGSKTLSLTSEQRFEINESMKEAEQGLVIDQIELDKEFDKWSSER